MTLKVKIRSLLKVCQGEKGIYISSQDSYLKVHVMQITMNIITHISRLLFKSPGMRKVTIG